MDKIKLIEDFAKKHTSKLGIYGWPHVQRVYRLCMLISRSEREEGSVDMEVLRCAALLHDIAKHVEQEDESLDHGAVGAAMAEEFLKSMGFEEDKISLICHAIRAHTGAEHPVSMEAKILHDADMLDKLGAVGIATIFVKACLEGLSIEEVAEAYRLRTSKKRSISKHMKLLENPRFYTETASKIAKEREKFVHIFFEGLLNELNSK